MKKFLALAIALCLTTASAQTARRKKTGVRARGVTAKQSVGETSIQLPVFLARRGPATINEMMIQPPAFSYGSSINVWLLKDKDRQTREIAVTGHADSATCRRVSGQVMSLFIEKKEEPEDLFVAGAARMVDRGEAAKKEKLLTENTVQEFIKAEKELWATKFVVMLLENSPSEGKDDKTALEKARATLAVAQGRIDELQKDPSVQAYLKENNSAKAINNFIRELREFSSENGLVSIHEIPFELIDEARARIAKVAASAQGQVVSFEDLLNVAELHEAALFSPMLTVPGGRPVELRIPLASIRTLNFAEAQRNNRDEVEQAIVGNAKDRLAVFKQTRQRTLRNQERCNNLSPAELDQVITLRMRCTPEGVCYKLEKTDKQTKVTRREYCAVQVPLNLSIVNEWIDQTNKLLKKIDEDAERKDGSRISEINYATLVDSLLRDWRLPVSRSQAAFDKWRGTAREPVWRSLNAQLKRMGIAPNLLGGEQMIFSVKVDHQILIVRPIHVIDMARSVLVVDPTAGATRVLDAWSMRSQPTAKTSSTDPSASVQQLISESTKLLAAGDRAGAEAQIVAAFSRDPATAFRSVQREWLQQFPDTRQKMLAIQQSLKPMVEAVEWKEGFEAITGDPSSKEGLREEIEAFHTFLESYPRAPVDLHLSFAFRVAGYLAEFQNELNNQISSPERVTPWNVLLSYVPGQARTDSGGGTVIPLQINRQKLEAYLRSKGLKGKSLQKAMEVVVNIRRPSSGGPNDLSYLEARSALSLALLADPAPMIREALQTVIKREPAYWAAAIQAGGLPKERSEEWKAADHAIQREFSLFESDAQLLDRLEDQLRKSYLSSTAADVLSAEGSPNLRQVLPIIEAAVGDGRTGSSPSFRGPQQTVKLFIEQQRVMDTLTRLQNASSLRRGSEELLAIARSRISGQESPEVFRDAIPLRANLWFESGDYLKSLEALLTPEVPIALYGPTLSWQSLPGDAVTKPLRITARLEGSNLVFEATLEGDKKADVLLLQGLPAVDAHALLKDFSEIPDQRWSEFGKVSQQILLTPVTLRPALQEFRDLLLGPKLRMLLMKSMVYGRNVPGSDLVSQSDDKTLTRVVALIDQVNGDGGRTFQIPTLNEVKQIAKTKVRPQ